MKRLFTALGACLALAAPSKALAFDGPWGVVDYDHDGTLVPLTQFKGKHVELLLPPSWLPGDGLTDEQRRILIDRFDITYEYFTEIVGWEPALPTDVPHENLLRIAVVDIANPMTRGLGWFGLQRMEIDINQLEMFRDNLEDGFETERTLMIHEMGHCFDAYPWYLRYDGTCNSIDPPNWCHAWTNFFDGYVPYYGRVGGIRETFLGGDLNGEHTADSHWASWVDHTYLPYYSQLPEPEVSWADCVAMAPELPQCLDRGITARDTWAGVTHRWAELFGPVAVRRAMAWLADYAAANPSPDVNPVDAARRHILMLSAGAEENLSCFLEEWEWYTTPELEAELEGLYGGISAKCLDYDLDGYSPLQGDCRDSNMSVHPGATEVVNGLDDDCNRYVDDVTPPPAPVLPLDFWGRVHPPEKDGVDFVLSSSMFTLDEPIVNDTPVFIRYWVTGQGIVDYVEYSDDASTLWTPPVDLPAGTYGYRAQLVSETGPASEWTELEWFDYDGPCDSDLDCDDGNAFSIDECTSSGLCSNVLIEYNVYEANGDMSHSVGNAWGEDDWNVYGNGYVAFTHAFAGGWQFVTVRAAGQYAGGSWPNMRVTIGGSQVFESLVQTSTFTDYSFWVNRSAAGNAEVRVYFTNDYYYDPPGSAPPLDRNLLVDKVIVYEPGGPGQPPIALDLGGVNTETHYTVTGSQALIISPLSFNWTPARIVVGFGQTDGASMSGISVSVNGGATTNLTGNWQTITIPYTGQSSINLTVYSTTSRALRTVWWAEG